jgi:glutathione synthase/RimK-type ligase-like ATP-grasp enzyme
MQDEFRFHSAFGDIPPEALPDCAPSVGVVLNNCVNGETMNIPGRLERALHAVRWAGRPVINHPEAIAATTRQKTAELLRGIPGLKVPRIARYQIGPAAVEDILADIESRFGYPVIVRLCQAHRSADHQHSDARLSAVLAHDRAEARAALANLGAPEIYALEYVPLQKKSGHFRKIRALLAEDEIVCAVPGFYNTWMVSGARRQATGMAFYRAHPETVEESRRIVLEPESVLGVDCLRVLETVRDRMPLDFFGIDFDVDDEGQVVFFEANAAMNLLKHSGDPEDIALPDAPFERIKAAFRRAVDRRIGASA